MTADRPALIRYRVYLWRGNYTEAEYVVRTVSCERSAANVEGDKAFVRWLGEWEEAEL